MRYFLLFCFSIFWVIEKPAYLLLTFSFDYIGSWKDYHAKILNSK
jgi:hypothetical protein